jgi:hypothetical protein
LDVFVTEDWRLLPKWDQRALTLTWLRVWGLIALYKVDVRDEDLLGPNAERASVVVVTPNGLHAAIAHYDWDLEDYVVDFYTEDDFNSR